MERKAYDYLIYGPHDKLLGRYDFLFATENEMMFQATGIYQGAIVFKKKVRVEVYHEGNLIKTIGGK